MLSLVVELCALSLNKALFGLNKDVLRAFMKSTSALGLLAYLKPLGALGLLLRWLAHLVLHCTDEAQLG